jgi:CheY-like chemotaxis protein
MTHERQSILVVDDTPEDIATIRRMLADVAPEMEVREASTGADGLRASAERAPACILLDFNLPDMIGTEFLRELVRTSSEVPVAVLTGQENTRLAAEAFSAGAEDYSVKGTATARCLLLVILN